MENPFKKMFRSDSEGGSGSAVEEVKVVDTDFEVRDDGVYVRDVLSDGSSGEWKMLYDNPTDSEGSQQKYKEYRSEKGLSAE